MWKVLVSTALLFQPPGAAPAPDPAGKSLAEQSLADRGVAALDAGRYDDAVEILNRAVAADAADHYALFNLGVAYSLLQKDAEAIPVYKKVLELQPGLYEANINLGQSLLRSGDAPAAVPYLAEAHRQKPAEFRPAYYLAEALADAGRQAEAIDPYSAAIAIDPNSAPAELGLARGLLSVDRLTDAEPHYRKAAALDPPLKSYLLELASRFEERGETAAAIALYREFPDDPAVNERIGVLLFRSGDLAAATTALETAVAVSPTKANRTALAQTYIDRKDLDRADVLLAQLVAEEPRDFDLRMFYARFLRDQRKIVSAGQQFEAALAIKPDSPNAWSELAGMLILAEQYPQALVALDRARDLGLENLGHLFFRATTLDRLREREEAVEYYNKFLDASQGKNPDQEFQARQRIRVLELEMGKR